jgi:hypothetical protein
MSNFLPLVEGRKKNVGVLKKIWTGEGASKRRPEKLNYEEIFCTPPEILVL